VLAAEHLLDFGRLDLAAQRVEALRELARHVLAGPGPFDEHRQVVRPALQRRDERALVIEAAAALEGFLRLRLVLPEIRFGDPGFQAAQFFVGVPGLKDSSADLRSA
jgi:hypothetical protein